MTNTVSYACKHIEPEEDDTGIDNVGAVFVSDDVDP